MLRLGRTTPPPADGLTTYNDDEITVSPMIFPSIAMKLDLSLISLTVGVARYQERGRPTMSVMEVRGGLGTRHLLVAYNSV